MHDASPRTDKGKIMNTSTRFSKVVTFCASVAFGCTAALAAASIASVSQASPSLRNAPTPVAAPVQVVRLEPITVTVSKATYAAVRNETAFAAANAKKVTRG
jgi:hypothetical protein